MAAFWRMYHRLPACATRADSLALIQGEYLDRASPALRQLMGKKNYAFGAADVYRALRAYPRYWASIEQSSGQIERYRGQIYAAFRALKRRYPAAVFPDFTFAMGVFGSGGTGVPAGMFIGAEIEAAAPGSPLDGLPAYLQTGVKTVDKIALICAHELTHFQQRDHPVDLLGAAIHEGVCDFIGELIAGGQINEAQHAYGAQHETALWTQFRREMTGQDYSNWLYNGGRARALPADMGYYVGYRICQAYYQRARDKRQAIRDILTISDYAQFLAQSGYGQRFAAQVPAVSAERYDLRVDLNVPTKTIRVEAKISVSTRAGLPDTVRLLLHKGAAVQTVTVNGRPCRFGWQASPQPANRYLPESRYLLLFPARDPAPRAVLTLRYTADLSELAHNTSSFTPDWVSLASYSAWYPVDYAWGNYAYDVSVGVPRGYRLSGTGAVSRRRGRWHLTQARKTFDMVLVASRRLQTKSFRDEGVALRLDYIDYPPAKADSLLATTRQTYALYKTWFGPLAAASALTIAATPNKGNSAYARSGFIALQTRGQSSFATAKTISHEAAHLWWSHAGSDDWHDWLNEGFAEFSTLCSSSAKPPAWPPTSAKWRPTAKRPARCRRCGSWTAPPLTPRPCSTAKRPCCWSISWP
ncbi:DUF2268 domain-containing putative Zn-dependent protease [Hymenobacter sp.]|uniref:DUF2268 domain-containing putative Zn-dependent protease n=1 Tax=Hymenobacter sp. TaxID=1898978 RepID=UPI00286B8097|nr:DUF2268 domain-containing putative Zn-dependent protease [Hymenobacter sp.]